MPDIPMIGEEFAGHRLLSVLGRGGMSIVFRAENPRLGNMVALKVLDPSLADDHIFRSRFLEESRIAASMNHPNVIPIHDMGSDGGLLYIAMRYVAGTDLRQMLGKRGRLQPETAVFLLEQAARALDAAHRRGLVHRDVKPGNLLVERGDEDGDPAHVYLADFGITKHMGDRTGLTSSGQFLGTIDYVAPEQIRGNSVLGFADQYSLGCVLYECLTGRVPFEKDLDAAIIWAHVEEAPTLPTAFRPDLPPAIDDVFARVLAKDPGDRYDSCRDFMAASREALGHLAEVPPSSGPLLVLQTMPERVPGPAESTASANQADPHAPQAPSYPSAELSHESAGALRTPTAGWSAFDNAWISSTGDSPPPPTSQPARADDPPGGDRPSQRGTRGRAWLAGVAVLVLAVGATAAGVTLALTRGHGSPAAAAGQAGAPSVSPGTGGGTGNGSAAVSLAMPTVAEKIPVGQTPSYVQVAPNGKFAYIVNPGARAISVLNTADDKVSGTIPIPQGPPQFVSFSPDSRTAYVSVYNTRGSVHLVAFVDTATRTVTSTVSVDNRTPGPSTTSPDGRYLYVPNHNMVIGVPHGNLFDVIDTGAKKLLTQVAVPPNPHWIVFGKNNGRYYATDHMSTTVTVLNSRTNAIVGEISVGETPHSIAISPDGSRLAITSYNGNQVFMVSTATDKEVATIPVGRLPLQIAYSPDGRYIFTANNEDNTVTVIDASHDRVLGDIPTGKSPTSITVLPNGRQAYISDENDGTVEVLNIPK